MSFLDFFVISTAMLVLFVTQVDSDWFNRLCERYYEHDGVFFLIAIIIGGPFLWYIIFLLWLWEDVVMLVYNDWLQYRHEQEERSKNL